MDRKSAFVQAWATVRSSPVSPKVQKAIELFGSRWGTHTQTDFIRYEPTVEEMNSIFDRIYGWHKSNASNVFNGMNTALSAFAAHVEMSEYSDYRPGYRSDIFKQNVCEVLNTAA